MNDLTQLLERATDDLQPDVASMVARATTRGRRMRTRRRLASGLGVVTAAAVVGAIVVVTPAYVGGETTRTPPIATRPTQPAGADLPSLQALRDGQVVAIPGQVRLIDSWGSRDEGFVAASWSVTPPDGGGAGQVQVIVEYADPRYQDNASLLKDGKSSDAAAAKSAEVAAHPCVEAPGPCERLADGGWLMMYTAAEPRSGGGASDIIGAHASRWTPGGLHIEATSYNAMGEKDTATTRDTPVLDEDQLSAIVRAANLG